MGQAAEDARPAWRTLREAPMNPRVTPYRSTTYLWWTPAERLLGRRWDAARLKNGKQRISYASAFMRAFGR